MSSLTKKDSKDRNRIKSLLIKKILNSHFQITLSYPFKRETINKSYMSLQTNIKKEHKNIEDALSYLEKKYGKEPLISVKELKETRWNWH